MIPTIVSTIAVTGTGLLVGVELAVAVFVTPIFDRLPGDASIAARSDGARVLGRVMPFWYVGALLMTIAVGALAWGSPAAVLAAAAGALLVLSILMSVLLLVPINDRAIRWATEGAPADAVEQHRRWDSLHAVRVVIIVVALVLLVLAIQ